MTSHIISKISITDGERTVIANHLKREQETALKDLLQNNHFKPLNLQDGPYDLDLSIQEGRLVLQIRSITGQDLNSYVLSVKPYRRLIEDYFLMIRSHEKARLEGRQEKLEAIDMGRRGLHNEGAQLLIDRLQDKIEIDFETARRFFTLICVLHEKHLRLMR
jgi:uncharacterized protein (UPF0262 family)